MIKIVWLSFAFAFSELLLMIIKHSTPASSKTRRDRGSMILLWAAITFGFTAGFILSEPVDQFWSGFGVSLLIAGLIIRWIAILSLGRSFTVDVAITDTATLKTDGIYERIRHPSYLGLLLIVTGFAAAMSSLYSFLVFVPPVFLAIAYRIAVEEKLLQDEFRDTWLEYKSRTRKVIPGIW